MATSEGIVSTNQELCRRCYTCVRNCPARAIRVTDGKAQVIPERCIACGNCVRVCSQSAKSIQSGVEQAESLLAGPQQVVAALAPSFPASFGPIDPGSIVAGLRALGFARVVEVAFGAQLVAREYARLAREGRYPLISTSCPALVSYIEKYQPSLVPNLAPIVSPMVATGRLVKRKLLPDARVVFIGPCVAKKAEAQEPAAVDSIDCVLTFAELKALFEKQGINLGDLTPSEPDAPRAGLGRIFPVPGGLLQTAGLESGALQGDALAIEGTDNCLGVLRELAEGALDARFLDLLLCQGCVDGPAIDSDTPLFSRREAVSRYARSDSAGTSPDELERALSEYSDLDLSQEYIVREITLPTPSEEEILAVLRRTDISREEDELNCGACGYDTCREKAIAVCQGLAEVEMCLPYLINRLERHLSESDKLQSDLQSAQERLVQSEKMASMGQLAAGVAHELNNPLSSILIYSHLLEREFSIIDPRREDVQMIIGEATRCKEIVSGLLDFARQRQVDAKPIDVNKLVQESLARVHLNPSLRNVSVIEQLAPDLPVISIDAHQIGQVLMNLFVNAGEAMLSGGQLTVTTARSGAANVTIAVEDTGTGIPEENLSKLFTPFFTTKPEGRGTGLGLSIAYGIIKMHRGNIEVTSRLGQGTRFVITLPIVSRTGERTELIG